MIAVRPRTADPAAATVPLAILLAAVFIPMALETRRSRRHERILRAGGAIEPPADVYAVMQVAYPACFAVMAVEAGMRRRRVGPPFIAGAALFAIAKGLKYWAVLALGRRWTFRVLVPPGAPPVTSGPYRWMRHPNYIAVAGELAGAGLMAQARVTGPLSLLLFGSLMRARIRIEDRALGRAAAG